MPDEPAVPPKGPGPDAPVPDLKRIQANKPEGFVWTPNSGVARSAASVVEGRRAADKTWVERLRNPYVMAAGLGLTLVVGGGAFYLASVDIGETGGGAVLGAVHSTLKYRAVRGQDRVGTFPRAADDASQDRMNLAAIAAAEKKARNGGGKNGDGKGGAGKDGGDDAEPPMNYDQDGSGRRGGPVASVGSPANAGKAAGAKGGGSGDNNAYPTLTPMVHFRGMKMVSGTAGFHSLKKGRGVLRAGSMSRGTGSNPSGGASITESADAESAGASAGGAAGANGRSSVAPGAADGAASAAGSGSGGEGGGGGSDVNAPAVEDTASQIKRLSVEAAADLNKADKEKKMAEFLAAGGQFPQAHFHYERYEKAKKSADEKKAEAASLVKILQAQSGGGTAPPPPSN